MKIFGNRVNLDETERLLRTHFTAFDCACSGVDDKMSVFITDENAKNDVMEFLTEKLKFNSIAFRVNYVSSIPRNESGKILYKELSDN